MLTHIYIRDLATIEELHLNLANGTTMITGETGAGKSVFIEAIELALGGRASTHLVRPGKEKAEISLCFDIRHFPTVISRLKDSDLYEENSECIIRRILTQDGRSRCYVNGAPSTLPFIKELGELLFHLHSQYDQQILLKNDAQREILDKYADHLPLVVEVKSLADRHRALQEQIKILKNNLLDRANRSEYLRFQLDELAEINLKPGEWEAIEQEHRRLSHAEELMKQIQFALQQLTHDEEQTALSLLAEVRKTFESIASMESHAAAWINTIDSVVISLRDLEAELKNYLEETDLDPEKLQAMEARLSDIFNLARKHKIPPAELGELKTRLETEFAQLHGSDAELAELEKQQTIIAENYHQQAAKLTQSRKKAAAKLQKHITDTIRSLSLPHGEFKIELEIETEKETLAIHGKEKISFLIKTNPDQNLQPLAKTISGGELSRLSLAAHLALADKTNIPTLVFDEVDTGLSGATAEKIGKLLKKLGDSYQVFCITHQAQVAACGHHHLLVEKYFEDKTTYTRLRLLNPQEKTQEIARMLGGEKITKKTLEHAQEILIGALN